MTKPMRSGKAWRKWAVAVAATGVRSRRSAAGLLTAVMLSMASVITIASPAQASGPWNIFTYTRGPASNGALDGCVGVGDIIEGSNIVQAPCGSIYEQWIMKEVSAGWWQIYHAKLGFCMNVKGRSTTPGAAVIQYRCGYPNDRWALDKVGSVGGFDWYRIRNYHSGLCLNVPNGTTAYGAGGDVTEDRAGGDVAEDPERRQRSERASAIG